MITNRARTYLFLEGKVSKLQEPVFLCVSVKTFLRQEIHGAIAFQTLRYFLSISAVFTP